MEGQKVLLEEATNEKVASPHSVPIWILAMGQGQESLPELCMSFPIKI